MFLLRTMLNEKYRGGFRWINTVEETVVEQCDIPETSLANLKMLIIEYAVRYGR